MKWHLCSRSGDFTLHPDGEATRLEVVNPTADELLTLSELLTTARAQGWIGAAVGIQPTGTTRLSLGAPLVDVAPVLSGLRYPEGQTLSAVVSKAGQLEGVFDTPEAATRLVEDAPEAVAAVVETPRPRLGCPHPRLSAEVRANVVLRTLCTPRQWQSWMTQGCLRVRGGLSGLTFRVAHRHSRIAQRQGRVAWCEESREPVCIWNDRVPPPEEVASILLLLGHREADVIRDGLAYGSGTRLLVGGRC